MFVVGWAPVPQHPQTAHLFQHPFSRPVQATLQGTSAPVWVRQRKTVPGNNARHSCMSFLEGEKLLGPKLSSLVMAFKLAISPAFVKSPVPSMQSKKVSWPMSWRPLLVCAFGRCLLFTKCLGRQHGCLFLGFFVQDIAMASRETTTKTHFTGWRTASDAEHVVMSWHSWWTCSFGVYHSAVEESKIENIAK